MEKTKLIVDLSTLKNNGVQVYDIGRGLTLILICEKPPFMDVYLIDKTELENLMREIG